MRKGQQNGIRGTMNSVVKDPICNLQANRVMFSNRSTALTLCALAVVFVINRDTKIPFYEVPHPRSILPLI
jgi:hypothetical protein